MAGTKRTTYKNNWQKEKTDRVSLTVRKGQKAKIKEHAKVHEESINGFINRAINEALERDAVFDRIKETMDDLAEKYHVNIDEQELKKLAAAFAALKPHIPDIEKIYFSQRQQERQRKPFQVPPIKELGAKKDQDA